MKSKLEVESVCFTVNGKIILSDIYMKCETGDIVGLLGRSGTGKTSLFNIIYGNTLLNNRCVRVDDTAIYQGFRIPELILFLPQHNFVPSDLPLKRVFSDYSLDFSRFEAFFPNLSISYGAPMADLSGGCRRLVEIYVILSSKAKFVLLDEPFSHLSPIFVEPVKELIKLEREHKGIIITDHMYNDVISLSDKVYIISVGKTHLMKNVKDLQSLGYSPRDQVNVYPS